MNYFLLFVMILLVISEIPFSSSSPELYEICSNQFSCGNVHAGFPFWGGDRGRPECGHPRLQLHCENDNTAILEIFGVRYQVLEFNQEAKRLKIARESGVCPNITLDATIFVSPDYVNLTLLNDCPAVHFPFEYFSCSLNGVKCRKVYLLLPGLPVPIGCSANATVMVPKPKPFPTGEDMWKEIGQALITGFEVEWRVDDEGYCQKCIASEGKCGINPWNETETVCYCQEQSSSEQECLPLPPLPSLPARPPSNADEHGKYLMSRHSYSIE
ncbi:hypothetical protein SLEP1_g56951 [Rubroshorea leprosula]|uniref:non-specific serine/threonine protein kinase n=1 Tax=Rubroshorea leprosula TaxID=152421 RepID=A0AAV5ML45_9ROSI|nr:hypothetical protein SLEP1_g56951 [Rubroshorea leprosula]